MAKLEAAHVVLDPQARAERIEHDAAQLAFARGLEVAADSGLPRSLRDGVRCHEPRSE